MCVCDVNDHVPFFCRLNNLMCCGNRGKSCTCCSMRNLSTVHNTGPYLLLCGNAPFITNDLSNRVEGQLLYDRMIDEAQIPVANICNVPRVVFSIVWPMYIVHVHRTGTRCAKQGKLASECNVCQFVIAVVAIVEWDR